LDFRFKNWWLILALGLFFWGLDSLGFLNPFKNGVGQLLGASREKVYQKIIGPVEELEHLERQLISCQGEVLELREENSQARRLLDAGIKPKTRVILAKLVGGSDREILASLTSQEEFKEGASVVSGRVLVGKVQRISGQGARIGLLNSSGIKIPVKIWLNEAEAKKNSPTVAEGILVGDGHNLRIKEILASDKIRVSDLVGALIETGEVFLIGEITEIFPSEDKVFQEAKVKWLIDPKKLLTVGIIK